MKRKRIILAFVLMLALVFGSVPARMSATASESGGGAGVQEPGAGDTAAPDAPQKKKLDTPTGLKWDDSGLIWNVVPGASWYDVTVYKDQAVFSRSEKVRSAKWSIEQYLGVEVADGSYYLKVIACASSQDVEDSEPAQSEVVEFKQTELPAPTNLRWDGDFAVWDPVPGVSYYDVALYIDGTQVSKDYLNAFLFKEPKAKVFFRKDGAYSFQVRVFRVENLLKHKPSQWSASSEVKSVNTGKQSLDPPSKLEWDGNAAKWSKVEGATGYSVEVSPWNLEIMYYNNPFYVKSETCAIAYESGQYQYRVKAIGDETRYNNSEWSEWSEQKEIKLTPLDAPTNLKWEGNECVWDAVEGASSYSVEIYAEDGARIDWCNVTEPKLPGAVGQGGTYQFRVQARLGLDKSLTLAWSAWSDYSDLKTIELTPLGTPANLKWKGNGCVWDAVEGASSYIVDIKKDGVWIDTRSVTEPKVSGVMEQDGTYQFRVQARADNSSTHTRSSAWSDYSDPLKWTLQRIAAPTGLTWEGLVLKWNAVPEAQYERIVYKNGIEYERWWSSSVPQLEMYYMPWTTSARRDLEDGDYYIKVRSIPPEFSELGNSEWVQSPTLKVNRTELSVPANLRWDGDVAVWDAVPGASVYRVKLFIDGEAQFQDSFQFFFVEGTQLDELVKRDGAYSFQVQAFVAKDELKYRASQWSASSPINDVNTGKSHLTPPSTLGWEGNAAKWSKVEGAEKYLVQSFSRGEMGYTESDTFAIALWSGSWKYRVKAIAGKGNETYYDSEWSEWSEEKTIELTPLGTPANLRWKGSVGVWDPVEGASSYTVIIYKDGVRVSNCLVTKPEVSGIVNQGGKYKFEVMALAVDSLAYEWYGKFSEFSAELNWEPDSSSDASPSPTPEPTATPAPVQTPEPTKKPSEWATEEDGGKYWYEDGVKQGTEGRGKEIFDPESGEWYWLDAENGGKIAVSKDVYQEGSIAGSWAEDEDGGTGKWVRYDENGHMVKGWDSNENGTYYFDLTFGTMAKGYVTIEGDVYYFDKVTGTGTGKPCSKEDVNGWVVAENGNRLWYEGGERQGTEGRGKEIYDPETDAWYWLDSVDDGKKAVSKDVYQEFSAAGAWAEKADGTGKWVRYDKKGHMVKGWDTNENGTYYFDPIFGTMAKGTVSIDGKEYRFDVITGILLEK